MEQLLKWYQMGWLTTAEFAAAVKEITGGVPMWVAL